MSCFVHYVIHFASGLVKTRAYCDSVFKMFDSFQRYVYDRRGGLLDTTISMSIAYAVNAHVRERWEEMKEKVARERTARQRSALFADCLYIGQI